MPRVSNLHNGRAESSIADVLTQTGSRPYALHEKSRRVRSVTRGGSTETSVLPSTLHENNRRSDA